MHETLGSNAFVSTLLSDTPAPELAGHDLYAFLLGSWDAEVIDVDDAGIEHHGRGEWHFARVLDGRAIQDVWISPPRSAPEAVALARRYGTSLRVFDREEKVWRVSWRNPVSGTRDELVGRRVGDDIVQVGERADGTLIRWTFKDVRADACTWLGEASRDGRTWTREAEFRLRRPGKR